MDESALGQIWALEVGDGRLGSGPSERGKAEARAEEEMVRNS